MIGQQISHYKIIRKLGEGGMGEVYLAEDTRLQRPVALKFFNPATGNRPELVARFKQEALVAASLNHPNIVTIYEVLEHLGNHVIVMEYIDGERLSDLLQKQSARPATEPATENHSGLLPLDSVLDIARQIAAGLAAAHQGGVIHRDLKLDNILITGNGQVKILDFGLAKLHTGSNLTKSTDRFGTPNYMAPEQVVGQEVDQRTDVFAFGVILYELLCGCRPFRGDNDMTVLYAILNESPEPVTRYRPETPPWLITAVETCLQKTPAERYSHGNDVWQTLRHPSARSGTPVPEKDRVFRKMRWRVAVAAIAAIFLLAGISSVWFFFDQNARVGASMPSPSAVAVLPFPLQGNPDYQYLSEGMARLLGFKLDGAGDLRSVDARAIFSVVERQELNPGDVDAASQTARKFGARYFIIGHILMVGERLSLEARLYENTNPSLLISRSNLTCQLQEILDNVDRLATDLLTGLVTDSQKRLQRASTITTHSLPALKSFMVGESKFRRGDYQGALTAFQQAVESDTAFALAYYRLSLAADWLTRPDLANRAAQKAVAHSHRLSESDRSLLTALLAWQSGNAELAEAMYRTIVGNNRENLEAWFQLGEVQFHYGPLHGKSISAAREAFETVMSLEPDHVPSLWHLARIAALEGREIELKTIANHIRQIQPGGARELELAALTAFSLNDRKAQTKVLKALRKENDYTIALSVWNVAAYNQAFGQAEPLAALLTEPVRSPESRALGYIMLAHLSLAQGKWRNALNYLDNARLYNRAAANRSLGLMATLGFVPVEEERLATLQREMIQASQSSLPDNITPSIFFTVHNGVQKLIYHYLTGSLSLKTADIPSAKKMLAEIHRFRGTAEQTRLARDLARDLEAQMAVQAGNPQKALASYQATHPNTWYGLAVTSPFYSRAIPRYHQAALLFSQKQYRQALALYRTFGEYSVYDLIYYAPAMFMMGEAYRELNQPDSAAICYRKFLNLWGDCDPELQPRLAETKARLEQLYRQTSNR